MNPSSSLLITHARIFDGLSEDCQEGMNLLVADGAIQEVSAQPIRCEGAQVIDAAGRTLMPGLIDCHIHSCASDVSLQRLEMQGAEYRAAHAARLLSYALSCGFTTVRDVGGGNHSLYRAVQDELIVAPRFFYAGKMLSMTGGHGDMRAADVAPRYESVCNCSGFAFNSHVVIADGEAECIKAVREELRQGASFIKIMGSGGIASPTDPIWMNQYREDEIRAIVNECAERRTYVSAHCHPASAIKRCVEFGVKCIEHGTLIDEPTATLVAEKGVYVVPTLVTIEQLALMGKELKFPSESQEKAEFAWQSALTGIEIMRRKNIKLCFGTDLLGQTYDRQCREFLLRSEVFSPVEILRQATSMAAEMMMQSGKLGCIQPGAHADLLLVDGDPLADISLLAQNGKALSLIVRGGKIVKPMVH
jgi:imidazolonepropionase-like amidohydrolase